MNIFDNLPPALKLMETWGNEEVVEWLVRKGFGVWTPYFKVQSITGKHLISLSLDELVENRIEKSVAKKILALREKLLKKQLRYA